MKFCCYESQVLQEMTNFGDYPRDFRPLSGHWEISTEISNGDVFGYFPLASSACPNITLKIFLILYFMLNLVANLESLGSLTLI